MSVKQLIVVSVKVSANDLRSPTTAFALSLSFQTHHVKLVLPSVQHPGIKDFRADGELPKLISFWAKKKANKQWKKIKYKTVLV